MMKRLKIAVLTALVIAALTAAPALARQPAKPAAAVPRALSYVIDSSKALDAEQLKDINGVIKLNELRTGIQTVVVVAPSMGGNTITTFTKEVKDTVKFGEHGKPDVLFLVAVKEKAATIVSTAGTPLTVA